VAITLQNAVRAIPEMPGRMRRSARWAGSIRTEGNVAGSPFSLRGAAFTVRWPADMGHLPVNDSALYPGLSAHVVGSDAAAFEVCFTRLALLDSGLGLNSIVVARAHQLPAYLLRTEHCRVQIKVVKVDADTDIMHYPVPPERFYVPASTPQLTVSVRGLMSQCRAPNGCGYQGVVEDTPVITSSSFADGRIQIGGWGFVGSAASPPSSGDAGTAPALMNSTSTYSDNTTWPDGRHNDTMGSSANVTWAAVADGAWLSSTNISSLPTDKEEAASGILRVLLGGSECEITSLTDNSIDCVLVSAPPPGESRLEVRSEHHQSCTDACLSLHAGPTMCNCPPGMRLPLDPGQLWCPSRILLVRLPHNRYAHDHSLPCRFACLVVGRPSCLMARCQLSMSL
jgi:hypothetical protein